MFWRFVKLVLALAAGLNANSLGAKVYQAGIDDSQWFVTSSIFECALTHPIPSLGQGVFYHEAGEDLRFFLDVTQNPLRKGEAALVVEAPSWRPGAFVQDLGFVTVSQGNRPVNVARNRATNMMKGLQVGGQPTFTRRAWYSDESIRIALSSVNFNDVYQDYLDCVGSLLPVNFRQVERTLVLFKADEFKLAAKDREALDNVVLYVNADPAVTRLFVDGHTDTSGRKIRNRQLSKMRAESVATYLARKGVNPEIITVRFHGDRYPVLKNNSKANRARNRRATVRLVRGDGSAEDEEQPFN